MNNLPFFLTTLFLCIVIVTNAQSPRGDFTTQRKIPVQAFAAMPILLGVQVENDFAHDRKYKTFADKDLTLPLRNGQNYSIFGSLPFIRNDKGFTAKMNFAYNIFKDNIGTVTFNDRVVIEDAEGTATSAAISLNLSQKILIKKWKKKLILSGTFSASGKKYRDAQTYRGIVSAGMPLKMTPNSMFIIGAMGIIGKNIKQPILPILAYFTRISDQLNLEMILPISAQLRYVVSNKATLTTGARIGARTPFLDKDLPIFQNTDDALEFKSQHLRFYVNAEKAVGKLVWLQVEAGYNHNMKAALITPSVDLRNKLFIGTGFGYAYAQVGVFLRPVFKRKK